ncbi:MAG: NapC/NirT family cytochrome c [Bacillus sp. (in: firmicutes)]
MEEEQMKQTSPARNRYKLYKYLTVALFFIVVFFSIGAVGVETTSSSEFCSSCHEMKPEFYTWEASSHSEVDCVQCHIQSGVEEYAKAKANGLVEVYKKQTGKYIAPIRMPDQVPDESCEKCHNVFKREFSVSGDIIVDHVNHKENDVKCVECHAGTAHGNIDDRKMTFKADYEKWNSTIGANAMSDMKYVKPNMDTCIECHKAKDVTIECSACHSTGMVPESHKEASFVNGKHGELAKTELSQCHKCHKDMSTNKLEGFEEPSVIDQFLGQDNQTSKKSHISYSKENSFCVDCHNKRPASHTPDLISNHGSYASKNKETCAVCHDNDNTVSTSQNKVVCATCHSKDHLETWRTSHPVKVPATQKKPDKTCYQCHIQKSCTRCHK